PTPLLRAVCGALRGKGANGSGGIPTPAEALHMVNVAALLVLLTFLRSRLDRLSPCRVDCRGDDVVQPVEVHGEDASDGIADEILRVVQYLPRDVERRPHGVGSRKMPLSCFATTGFCLQPFGQTTRRVTFANVRASIG